VNLFPVRKPGIQNLLAFPLKRGYMEPLGLEGVRGCSLKNCASRAGKEEIRKPSPWAP
jgi:hypothetical protein